MANLLQLLSSGLPNARSISSAIDSLLGASDAAAARDAISVAGEIYGYQIWRKTDTQVSSAVAAQGNATVSGWVDAGGAAATLEHTPLAAGDLIAVRFTAGLLATSSDFANIGIAVEIGGTLANQVGDAAGNRSRVGSAGFLPTNTNYNALSASVVGFAEAANTSVIEFSARLINSTGSSQTLYLNRNEDNPDSADRFTALSTLEVWGVRQ